MRKILLSFFIIHFFSSPVSAQIKFGYKAGMNLSNIKKTIENENSVLRSFNTGIFSDVYFTPKCFFQIEFLYSIKGYNAIMIPTGTTANRLKYLSFPVLFGLKADKRIEFLFGCELDYLTKAVQQDKNGKRNVTDFYEKFDIGLDAGAIYSVTKRIKLEARYNYGLLKVTRQFFIYDNSGHGYSTSGFNQVFQLDIGYIF